MYAQTSHKKIDESWKIVCVMCMFSRVFSRSFVQNCVINKWRKERKHQHSCVKVTNARTPIYCAICWIKRYDVYILTRFTSLITYSLKAWIFRCCSYSVYGRRQFFSFVVYYLYADLASFEWHTMINLFNYSVFLGFLYSPSYKNIFIYKLIVCDVVSMNSFFYVQREIGNDLELEQRSVL